MSRLSFSNLPLRTAVLFLFLVVATWSSSSRIHAQAKDLGWSGYTSSDELNSTLAEIVQQNADRARLRQIGTSGEGRPLWMVEIGRRDRRNPDERPALLVVAGVDGTHLPGTEACLSLIKNALTRNDPAQEEESGSPDFSTLLSKNTLYVIPRINPDVTEHLFRWPLSDRKTNTRPVDNDRDGTTDEDGPEDLNGDGVITSMRKRDPAGSEMAHEKDPRLHKKSSQTKGEVSTYKIYPEGIDNDGDGEINEDGPGGVELNRNFPFQYDLHDPATGPHQISEPESRALADFFLSHRNIAAVLVYGPEDNLVAGTKSTRGSGGPSSGGPRAGTRAGRGEAARSGFGGRQPVTSIAADDLPYFTYMAEKYQEITKATGKSVPSPAGSFLNWVYYHYGIPGLGASIWSGPPKKTEEPDEVKEGDSPDPKEPEARPGRQEGERGDREFGGRGRGRRGGRGAPPMPPSAGGDSPDEDQQWLAYSTDRLLGEGFVDWSPYDHPTLGEVEIGGFVPFLRLNPPADDITPLLDSQVRFVWTLMGLLPNVSVEKTDVVEKGSGLFEVNVTVRNNGYLPTALRHGLATRQMRPIQVELLLGEQKLLAGDAKRRIDRLEGSGKTSDHSWLIQGKKGSSVLIKVTSRKGGSSRVEVRL